MRNQNCGAAFHDAAEAREDALFGLRVDGGKGIVEDQDARIANDGAGDGAALFLSAGESDAAFADDGVVFVGEGFDVGVEIGDFGGGADLLDAVFGEAEGDVAADGFAEEIGVLRNVADGAAQIFERPFADGVAVDEELAVGSFPEARDERGERGFAAAGGADDGERGAGGNFQIDVAQGRDAGLRRAEPLVLPVPLPLCSRRCRARFVG